MKRVLGLALLGVGLLGVSMVVVPWLLYRELQWRRRQRFMGHYEQPVASWDEEGERQASWAEAGRAVA